MTKPQQLVSLFILFLFIGAFGFGWNWFLKDNHCRDSKSNIKQAMDNQDDLLLVYGLFAEKNLEEDKQKGLRKYISLKEPVIKVDIEHFSKSCRSKLYQRQLISILKNFEFYTITKQNIFKENQAKNFKWIKDTYPFDPSISTGKL